MIKKSIAKILLTSFTFLQRFIYLSDQSRYV